MNAHYREIPETPGITAPNLNIVQYPAKIDKFMWRFRAACW